jgi:hypothetical protein
LKQEWQKIPADQANRRKKHGLFGKIERKIAKLSKTTFTYRSPLNYFIEVSLGTHWEKGESSMGLFYCLNTLTLF